MENMRSRMRLADVRPAQNAVQPLDVDRLGQPIQDVERRGGLPERVGLPDQSKRRMIGTSRDCERERNSLIKAMPSVSGV